MNDASPMTLDLTGLACPLPVLRANKALKPMAVGTDVRILASDPAAPADFRAFCATTGHTLINCHEEHGVFVIHIRKGAM
jgi:tRNA 2-thiouridine synthesizing protein A